MLCESNIHLTAPEDAGVTPALRRRRERAERQRSFIREQREANLRASLSSTDQSGSEDGRLILFIHKF